MSVYERVSVCLSLPSDSLPGLPLLSPVGACLLVPAAGSQRQSGRRFNANGGSRGAESARAVYTGQSGGRTRVSMYRVRDDVREGRGW